MIDTTCTPPSDACDGFPDHPCSNGCCDVYDACFKENNCDYRAAWSRLICGGVLSSSEPLPQVINLGILGEVQCTDSLLYSGGSCSKCSHLAVACYATGCSGAAYPNEHNYCFDSKCNSFFDFPACTNSGDSSCCSTCSSPLGSTCSSPLSCGDGVCDFGETSSNCFVDCPFTNCVDDSTQIKCNGVCVDPSSDVANCGACGIQCPGGLDCVLGYCSQPLANVFNDGGWKEVVGGKRICFQIEDSVNCNGPNGLTQSGSAIATITSPAGYSLETTIIGKAELEDAGFEIMEVFLDNVSIIKATSNDFDLGCLMGPPSVTFLQAQPLILTAGVHTFRINFTSQDEAFHVNAFYEFNLIFRPI